MKIGKLSASNLFEIIRHGFCRVTDNRKGTNIVISLSDALMSAFAMFSLKDSSLYEFDERGEENGMVMKRQISSVFSRLAKMGQNHKKL